MTTAWRCPVTFVSGTGTRKRVSYVVAAPHEWEAQRLALEYFATPDGDGRSFTLWPRVEFDIPVLHD